MFDLRPLAFIAGALLAAFGLTMLLPMLFDLASGHRDWQAFLISAVITVFTGAGLAFAGRGPTGDAPNELNLRQTFLLTTVSGIVLALFGAMPFMLVHNGLNFTAAFFEAMSGLTTTGASVISGLDDLPRGILVWRALLQWLGGIVIVVAAVAIMPMLRVGGMQLFRSESDSFDRILPRAGQAATAIGGVYLTLSIACGMALWFAGMAPFDAMAHAMTTVSAGGFSTSSASFAHWNNAWVEAAAMPFMLLAAMPFVLVLATFRGDLRALSRDSQVGAFLFVTALCIAMMTLYQWPLTLVEFWPALRHAAFSVVSLISSTGFVSTDYSAWGPFAMAMALFLMLLGGCTGSSASGLKIFRLQFLAGSSVYQTNRAVHASGVFRAQYNNRPFPIAAASAVTGFFFLYALTFTLSSVVLMAAGLDFITAISAAAAALGNVATGLGPLIGPGGNYSSLSDPVIWILSAVMLIGRLELLPVFVLLLPRFWRG